jgi:putative oxidoreductase
MDILLLIGRIILGGFFIHGGVSHFVGFGTMTHYAKIKGVPFAAASQGASGMMLLLGGISILCGVYPGVGILLLVVFLGPVSLLMHRFWEIRDPQVRMADKTNFMKNMALLGAILMLLAIPLPWPLSMVP